MEAVGLTVTVAALQMYSGWIELMAETPEMALPGMQDAYNLLERIGDGNRRAMTAAMLGRLLFFHGDYAEADRYLKISEECAIRPMTWARRPFGGEPAPGCYHRRATTLRQDTCR